MAPEGPHHRYGTQRFTGRCGSGRMPDGFTLLEVMVALVIISLGMMAVITQLNRYAVGAVYMEQKTLASWIAANRITELKLAPQWPSLGTSDEEIDFGELLWHSRTEVSETPVDNLRRIDVHVSLADDPERVVHTMTSLVAPPAARGLPPPVWPVPAMGASE